jgi:hypothetical protein
MYRTIIPMRMPRADRYAMERFFDSIPEVAGAVRRYLEARGTLPVATFRHFHHKKSLKASFIATTDGRLVCFTVAGLSSQLAALIDSQLSENERWDLHAFRAAISRILHEAPYRDTEASVEPAAPANDKINTREPTTP